MWSEKTKVMKTFTVINRRLILLWMMFLTVLASAAMSESPFAVSVVDYSPGPGQFVGNPQFNNPDRALGRPYGMTDSYADNTSVVTLGDGGSITLAFDHNVTDDPDNPGGYDFIVFSNALFVDGDPTFRWQEPAFVEISQDGEVWYLILPNILPSALVGGLNTGQSETVLRNYAEYTPALQLPQLRFPSLPQYRTPEEFYTTPDRQSVEGDMSSYLIDQTSGGGDAFDIADAVCQAAPGVPLTDEQGNLVPAGISWFRYIRLTDAVVGDNVISPYGELGEVSAEIDAVADIAPAVSVGRAKGLPDGTYVIIWGAIVTAAFDGEFWIQQLDRSAGIKVVSTAPVSVGDSVIVTGHVADGAGGKEIPDALVAFIEHGESPNPIGMTNRAAQSELAKDLLVKVWGKRTDSDDGWFNIDDGSVCPLKVLCSPDATVPAEGEFTTVTGVLSTDSTGNTVIRMR